MRILKKCMWVFVLITASAASQAQSQSKTICLNVANDPGWLTTSIVSGSAACGTGINNSKTIVNPAGSTALDVCALTDINQLPSGWVITNMFASNVTASQCPNLSNGIGVWSIKKTQNLMVIDICAGTNIPVGWLKTNSSRKEPDTAYGRCLNLQTSTDNVWTIKNTANMGVLEVCSGQVLPGGWVWKATSTGYNMCGNGVTASNNIWTISNNNISCSLTVSNTEVSSGARYSFTINGAGLPSPAYGYWHGTKNGSTDQSGVYFGTVPTTLYFTNSPGWHGYYSRSVEIRNASGNTLCTTNTQSVHLQPTPTCSLSVDKASVNPGQSYTFTVGGTDLPSGAQAYWYGTKNGVVDQNGVLFGQAPQSATYTSQSAWAGSYSRRLEIRDGATAVCSTNTVNVILN